MLLRFFSFLLLISILCGLTNGVTFSEKITVDQSGNGDFTTIQAAINTVPNGNKDWVHIYVKRGTYREKVNIEEYKEYILLEGDGAKFTTIEWGEHAQSTMNINRLHQRKFKIDTVGSATFTLSTPNFVARGITFANTYNGPSAQAVAASIGGDKAAFYNCTFRGVQDTLCDYVGRHYFKRCRIEGYMDFIFGFGRSIYEHCTIVATGGGYITAHGKYDLSKPGGFVFKYCTIIGRGRGLAYLGRSWGEYATVLFYKTYMSSVVHPKGWVFMRGDRKKNRFTFAEGECLGPGSETSKRKWERNVTSQEWKGYLHSRFIDKEGWRSQLP